MGSKGAFVALENLPAREAIIESEGYPQSLEVGIKQTWHFKSIGKEKIQIEILDIQVR